MCRHPASQSRQTPVPISVVRGKEDSTRIAGFQLDNHRQSSIHEETPIRLARLSDPNHLPVSRHLVSVKLDGTLVEEIKERRFEPMTQPCLARPLDLDGFLVSILHRLPEVITRTKIVGWVFGRLEKRQEGSVQQ